MFWNLKSEKEFLIELKVIFFKNTKSLKVLRLSDGSVWVLFRINLGFYYLFSVSIFKTNWEESKNCLKKSWNNRNFKKDQIYIIYDKILKIQMKITIQSIRIKPKDHWLSRVLCTLFFLKPQLAIKYMNNNDLRFKKKTSFTFKEVDIKNKLEMEIKFNNICKK